MRIAVDVASGERPVKELVEGCIDASIENDDILITLVGNRGSIELALAGLKYDSSRVEIRHAQDIVGMDESPAVAIKHKRNSSVMVAARMVGSGEARGFFSPGNTGATLAAALLEVGRLKGVLRPPLMSIIPNRDGEFCMLDMGANVDCTAEYLVQFAIMGAVFSYRYSNVSNPRVALLNIGEENSKGNALYKKAFERLEKLNINFVGNIEPTDMLKLSKADVVVCDGFDGNIVLKSIEGTAGFIVNLMKTEIKKSPLSTVGALFMKPVFNSLKEIMSADSHGAAVLLGLKGGAFVGHGKTTAVGMKNSILTMNRFLQARVNEHIISAIQNATHKKRRLF